MPFISLALLSALLAAAVRHDVRARRIPNAVVFPGMLAALVCAMLPGGPGLLSASGGLALGLAVLMPLYVFRLMGAGDVKLLAMVGAFFGVGHILAVTVATLLAGGVLALAVAAWQRSLRRLVGNAGRMVLHTSLSALAGGAAAPVQAPATASGRLPYALAIALAGIGCALWLRAFGELPL